MPAASPDTLDLREERDARIATRVAFLVSGFGLACWAPLVPLAKARLGIDDAALGLLLLCLGMGSVVCMQLAGPLASRLGAKPVILAGGIGMALVLPALAVSPTVASMAASLLAFGGFLGAIEVGMNVHAVAVEKRAGHPLMSGFHGLFSVGGFAGSMLLTLALTLRIGPIYGSVLASGLMLASLLFAAPRLIVTERSEGSPLFVVPRGIVILLALLAAITFLTEGAILDWGALLLTAKKLVVTAKGGIGYSAFAIAMTAGRLTGDAVVRRLGDRGTMVWGGLLAIAGYATVLTASAVLVAILGFVLIGLGASNTVPILFRRAGSQGAMPTSLAVASITTVGYAGILAGPAAIGFVAQRIGLAGAFWILAGLLCLVPVCARSAMRSD